MYSFSKAAALATVSLVTLASAQSNLDVALAAYSNPNATHNITFNPYPNVKQLADLEWTWRINISDSLTDPFFNVSTDFIVRTSYEFIWEDSPLNSTLAEAIPELGNQSFCAVQLVLSERGWPANITNLWTDEDANSTSCAPVLGQDCVDAIIKSAGSNNGGPCLSPGGRWEDAPECASSLGYMYSSRLVSGKQFIDLSQARSGVPFTGLASRQYSDLDNKTLYENYLNDIHMLFINAPVDLVRENGIFDTHAPKQLLCMRVNTSRREVDDDDEGGNDEGNDGGNDDGNGGNDSEEGNEGGDGGNAAGRDSANWWTMTGALLITAMIGVAL
ncbi:hypothetical protein QBC41DRAFT_329476 [Cercophora samala]|uniref:Uncharacterized protein n=1 Tax=Cercophora samala TaxID=330535 RepID=A0AA39Z2F7_9PEZI|nr:hypothetical protein QBC41DRAFT_329476 [Cercophora samala]